MHLPKKYLLTALVLALAGGCSRSHNVIGTWDIQGGPGPAAMTLGADGNFKTEATMPGRSSTVTGQYKLDGDTLILTTVTQRKATLKWNSDDEAIMTGDDGKAMTIARRK